MNLNNWNIIRYSIYSVFYDLIVSVLNSSRKKSIEKLNIQNGENVLIVGCGTGTDLKYINAKCNITAIDITPIMVKKTKSRAKKMNKNVNAIIMNAEKLEFDDNYFDKVILHTILTVVSSPSLCFSEAERVLKEGGYMTILDKFSSKKNENSFFRKLLNPITYILFSRINLSFGSIYKHSNMKIKYDKPTFRNLFRIILLKK